SFVYVALDTSKLPEFGQSLSFQEFQRAVIYTGISKTTKRFVQHLSQPSRGVNAELQNMWDKGKSVIFVKGALKPLQTAMVEEGVVIRYYKQNNWPLINQIDFLPAEKLNILGRHVIKGIFLQHKHDVPFYVRVNRRLSNVIREEHFERTQFMVNHSSTSSPVIQNRKLFPIAASAKNAPVEERNITFT
ncbi:hypothetical protein PRIPAC_76078, partial [Pristionchus pacificus]|uniref:Uncharacterized protein n=1 Tax=Pristionchus pacificus TaxID=54126 RepID=A0A2A6CS29_PRIPA